MQGTISYTHAAQRNAKGTATIMSKISIRNVDACLDPLNGEQQKMCIRLSLSASFK